MVDVPSESDEELIDEVFRRLSLPVIWRQIGVLVCLECTGEFFYTYVDVAEGCANVAYCVLCSGLY